MPIGPSTPKERPLAARRRLVSTKSMESMDTNESSADGAPSATDADDKPSTEENVEKKESSLKLPPKKTLEEIEREVAENTAKFDEKALGKNKASEEAQSQDRQQLDTVAQKVVQKQSFDASSLMRLMRVLFIFIMAFYTGEATAAPTSCSMLIH